MKKWTVGFAALLAIGAVASITRAAPPTACPQPALEPFCGNWWIRSVTIELPNQHMQETQGFAIRRKAGELVLFPRGSLKLLWGIQKELELIPADGDVPACLTTVVEPHEKSDMSGMQKHVIRFLEANPAVDPDTGEAFRRLAICMDDGDENATDCVCDLPHGARDFYHGGYSHAED